MRGMTEITPTDSAASAAPLDAEQVLRILEFARSEVFDRTYSEGMGLVEETAGYLDGIGRAASKRLSRTAALAYAGESMRLTTRLMQVASWLLVQRAVRDGEISIRDAANEKYRFTARRRPEEPFAAADELPGELKDLIRRSERLFERVRRLDETMYDPKSEDAAPIGAAAQLSRLRDVFGG
jgi:regulator of CtrA degradation